MRRSAFDGMFYPRGKKDLLEFIDASLKHAEIPEVTKNSVAYVAPHAGYMYSGTTAAYTYKAIAGSSDIGKTDTIIVVGPNHTGLGSPISVSMEDWETPVGKSVNDRELSKAIAESSEYIEVNESAHKGEHSIEVQLPFLQRLLPKKRFCMICMGDQRIEAGRLLSDAIISASEGLKRNVIVVASSDFNHYESAETAKNKDSRLLEAAKALDWQGIIRLADETMDSACGIGPMSVAIRFARHRGSKKGIILRYCNSGDTTGDYSSVVAYSAIAFVR